MEFHNILRKAGKNMLLYNLCAEITGTIYDERRVLFSRSDQIIRSLSEHQGMIDAFESGDIDQIKQSCRNHFVSTRKALEAAISSGMKNEELANE
jgi:DNA-binding GntR family transcriptional regulator